ncbi:SNF2 family helicase [Aspergillus luchuensis]|uniref:SNF2 family helicase n=1 Tax=Aspergillus kawachii TaxID=1069201 RepID=A0A146F643_ASPKA|nr:SNF2 family helicase [Aspergillus luchuensis]
MALTVRFMPKPISSHSWASCMVWSWSIGCRVAKFHHCENPSIHPLRDGAMSVIRPGRRSNSDCSSPS